MDVLDTILRTLSAIVHLFYPLFVIIIVMLGLSFVESQGDNSVKARVFRILYLASPIVLIVLYFYA